MEEIICDEDAVTLNLKKPLIIEIPDRHGNGRTKDSITKYVKDAIGVEMN